LNGLLSLDKSAGAPRTFRQGEDQPLGIEIVFCRRDVATNCSGIYLGLLSPQIFALNPKEVGRQVLLALESTAQMLGLGAVERNMKDAAPSIAKVDAGRLQLRQDFFVESLAIEAQLLESRAAVAALVTEGCKHARGGAARLAGKLAPFEKSDIGTGASEKEGDGATNHATTHDDDFSHG
jgi:hypothetical protein